MVNLARLVQMGMRRLKGRKNFMPLSGMLLFARFSRRCDSVDGIQIDASYKPKKQNGALSDATPAEIVYTSGHFNKRSKPFC